MNIIGHKKKGILRGTGGYSLVELAIVIPITVIVAAGIYAVFNHAHKSSISQKVRNDLQTSCTFAMDYIRNDLSFIGYRAIKNPSNPITSALPDTITFEFWDDRAVSDPPYAAGYSNGTLVTYDLSANNLEREFKRYKTATSDYDTPTSQILAENVQNLAFSYFTEENTVWDGADRADIRTVAVALTCAATREDPLIAKVPTVTLTGEVRARNIGVASTPSDTTPPAAPAAPIVWDEGVCGELQLRWPASTEADLAGYTILYGLASGDYSGRRDISRGTGTEQFAALLDLDSTKYADINPSPGIPVTYYIALLARDQSGNQSATTSAEVSGNPTPSSKTAAAGAANLDSTINPNIPAAPLNFRVSAPSDNMLRLEWDKAPEKGLLGYRLYRSTDPSFIPDDTPGTGNLIVGEGATGLDATRLFYDDDDNGAGLDGCRTYYYQIAAIACDNTLPNDQMLYSAIDGEPTDAAKPPSPTLTARPGFRRIILNFINPTAATEPDFLYTKVWYNTSLTEATHPTVAVDSINKTITVPNGEVLPPFENDVFTNPRGTFSDRGTQLVNFNNGDVTTYPNYAQTMPPILQPCTEGDLPLPDGVDCTPYTFRFTAVSFDLCWNVSEITSASIAEGDMCVDEDGPPPQVTNLVANLAPAPTGCFGSIQLDWDAIDPFALEDLSGYHIWRCEGVDCTTGWTELTNDLPLWYNTWLDTTVLPGVVYTYRVSAADCYYEWAHNDLGDDSTLGTPAYLENLSVGRLEKDTSTPQIVTGYLLPSTTLLPFTVLPLDGLIPLAPTFLHDSVTIWGRNASASDLTLTEFKASWLDPTALLQRVAFGDNSTTPDTIAWRGSATSSTPVTFITGSVVDGGDETLPFVTRYGKVSDEADMREEIIEYNITYLNQSTGTSGCGARPEDKLTFNVPLGPYGYGTTQSQPTAGTLAWPVPGSSGNAMDVVVVPGGPDVDVYTNIFDSSLGATAGIISVKLYYYVDDTKLFNTAPALSSVALYPNLAPYTAIDMERVAGSQWRTPAGDGILRSDDSNVWYFIVAVDGNGNFDRLPEIAEGAYQYFQAPEDPCDTTPNAPALSGSYTSSSVDLTWTTPTTNADPAGWEYLDGAGFEIWRQADGAGWSLIDTVTDPDATTYLDSPAANDLGDVVYEYYVTAYDSCADPAPNISVASNIYTELEEDPCGTKPEGPVLTGVTGASSVDLTWTGPALNTSGTPYTDGAGFEVWRQRNLDPVTREHLATLPPGDTTYSDTPPLADLLTADYYYTVIAFDSCSPTPNAGTSNVYVDQLTLDDPCVTTPNPPQNLTGVADYSDVTLSWEPPATNATPAGTPYIDAGGYEVWRWDDLPVPGHRIWELVATISDPGTLEYTESPPDIGTIEYHYTVKAFDTCSPAPRVSAWHIPVYYEYVQDPCASIPTAPTLSGNLDAAPYVNLTWARPTGPGNDDLAGYEIWRDKDGGGYALVHTISNPDTVAWQDTAVAGDIRYAEYSYQIRSFDLCATANYSDYSAPWTETFVYDPCSPAPTVPIFPSSPALQSSSVTPGCPGDDSQANSVTLVWPEATATVGEDILYEVWRCRKNNKNDLCTQLDVNDPTAGPWELLASGLTDTQRTWTDTLPFDSPKWTVFKGPNYKYSYQVRAVNNTCTDAAQQPVQPSALSIVYAPCN